MSYQQPPNNQPNWQQQSQYPGQQYSQYYQQPGMPPQQPPKKRRGPALWIGGGCLGLVVLVIILVSISIASAGNAVNNLAATVTVGTSNNTSTQPASTGSGKWTTTHTFTGNGTQKTPVFTAPSDWKVLYTCANQQISGTSIDGALSVTVYGTDNTPLDVAVNAQCKTAKTTGETEEHQGGQVYLDMNGTGDWTVKVQELK